MMQKAESSIEEVPYCFFGSSIKFQGHTGFKNQRFKSNLSKITRPVAAIKSLRFALFILTLNMLNYKRFIDILYHILDFVQQKKTKFTMEQPYMLPILYCQ